MEALSSSQVPPLPSTPTDEDVFNRMLAFLPKKKTSKPPKFVKTLDDIPEISLPPEKPIQVALSLADRALMG